MKKKLNGIYGYWDTSREEYVYIGQSGDIYERDKEHRRESQYNFQNINRVIQNSPDRYFIKIIEENDDFSVEDKNILEKKYIKKYNTFRDSTKFNYNEGGNCRNINGELNPFFGRKHSKETKKKLSELNKGENNPAYGRVEDKHPMYGKTHSDEAKQKIKERFLKNENDTEFVEIRRRKQKDHYIFLYCKNGKFSGKNRLKSSREYDKVVQWAKDNNMSLTKME